jgi:hypothetical protein
MAIQCTNCGTQPRTNAKFCHACGTPIATTSLPSTLPLGAAVNPPQAEPLPFAPPPPPAATTETMNAQTAYMPQTPQTYHAPPLRMEPPKKKSSTALKIVLLTFVFLLLAGVAAIWMGVRWANRAADRVRRDGINLPNFGVSMDKDNITEEAMGVPPYPGAVAETPIILRGKNREGSGSFGTFTFTTQDSVDKVAEFYKEKLGTEADVTNVQEGRDQTVTLSRTRETEHLNIVITDEGNKTQIVITNAVGKPNNRRGRDEVQRMRDEAERMKREAERIQRELEGEPPPPPPPPPGR